jgi:hypothetical protein
MLPMPTAAVAAATPPLQVCQLTKDRRAHLHLGGGHHLPLHPRDVLPDLDGPHIALVGELECQVLLAEQSSIPA